MPWRRMGEWRYSSTFLYHGTRWWRLVSLTPLPLYSRYQFARRLTGPQSRYGRWRNEEILALQRIKPGRPARSHSDTYRWEEDALTVRTNTLHRPCSSSGGAKWTQSHPNPRETLRYVHEAAREHTRDCPRGGTECFTKTVCELFAQSFLMARTRSLITFHTIWQNVSTGLFSRFHSRMLPFF
jgi:hypothetical protein